MVTPDTERQRPNSTRLLKHLRLTESHFGGLREAVKPFADAGGDVGLIVDLCQRLYLAYYTLEADPDLVAVDFEISPSEIMVINHCTSVEDGAWAADVLCQTRQALFELITGRDAVQLAPAEETQRVLDAEVGTPPDKATAPADEKKCDWDASD